MTPDQLMKVARNIARRYAYAVWDRAYEVDDIAASALLYYYECLEKAGELPCHPDAWAVNYIKFGVLNCIRDRALKGRVGSLVDVDTLAEVLPDGFDVVDKVEAGRVVDKALTTDKGRAFLAVHAGYTLDECQDLLGLPIGRPLMCRLAKSFNRQV